MSTFGDRLKLLREEKKLSQDELGNLFELSQSSIGYYEKNKKSPSKETIQQFASFFNVSVDYLLGQSPVRNTNNLKIPEKLAKALANAEGMPEEQMDKLAEVIELLINQYQEREKPGK